MEEQINKEQINENTEKKEKKKRNPPMSPFEKQKLLDERLDNLKKKRTQVIKNANAQKTKVAGAILLPVLEDLGVLENIMKKSKDEEFIFKIQKILKESIQVKKSEIEG